MTRRSVVIKKVEITRQAEKQLQKVPVQIKRKFFIWIAAVEEQGILEVRKIQGFHDEPLKGDRKGQRSIRLNKQWRAIYIVVNGIVEFVEVQEVTPHEY